MKGLGDHLQSGGCTGAATQRSQHPRVEQQALVALAGVEFGKYVEAVHSEDA
jgi:hypothetical protein